MCMNFIQGLRACFLILFVSFCRLYPSCFETPVQGFEEMLDAVYQAGWQNALASAGLSSFFVTGGGLFLLHIIYNCGVMVSSGVVSVGTTVSLAMYCFMAGSSYTGMMTAYGDIQKCFGIVSESAGNFGHGSSRSQARNQ